MGEECAVGREPDLALRQPRLGTLWGSCRSRSHSGSGGEREDEPHLRVGPGRGAQHPGGEPASGSALAGRGDTG